MFTIIHQIFTENLYCELKIWIACGFSSAQACKLCRLKIPYFVKVATSMNKIVFKNVSFFEIRSIRVLLNSTLLEKSLGNSCWTYCLWYGYSLWSCKILYILVFKILIFVLNLWILIFGHLCTILSISSYSWIVLNITYRTNFDVHWVAILIILNLTKFNSLF